MRGPRSSRFRLSVSFFALASVAFPAAAVAQTEEQQVDAAEATEDADTEQTTGAPTGDEIVITGSRIPRANFDTPQPAVVMGGEQIEQRGYTNIADALEELPAFGVPGSSPVGTGQGGDIGSGQNFVNFFGLGDQRTLTLVNGRRFVSSNTASIFGPTGAGSQVDFNVLPTILVDRVETVAVGGAPIYGSDAIAGTINVITKRKFDGIQLDAQYAITERGDAPDYRIRGAAGYNFAGDRGNISIAGEYNKTGGLDYESRPGFGLNSFFTTPVGDSDFDNVFIQDRRIPALSATGIPQVSDFLFVLDPARAEAFDFQVGVTDNAQTGGNPLMFSPDGTLVPVDFGEATGNIINFNGGNGLVLPGNLLAPTRRYLGTALAQYELTDNVRLFGEAWYANSRGTTFRNQPEYNTYLFAAAGEPAGQFIISLDNPFLAPSARAIIANNIANNPASDANLIGADQDYFYLTRANTDIISGRASSEVELYRFVGGVDGTFNALGRDMTFELVGNYGHSATKGQGRAIVQQNLENALNAVSVGGNIVCGAGSPDPGIATISSTCAPLNPFGQQVSQAARDYITAITNPSSKSEQWVGTASVSGSLFDIWGGAVGFALGYEHRQESTSFDPGDFYRGGDDTDLTDDANDDGDPTNDRRPFGQYAILDPVSGKFNTDEVFGELTIPLIGKDNNIPLIRSLELNGAARYIDHSLAGSDWTWTAGATWQPIQDITFRGNFTRSVRAPAITEFFNPTSQTFTTGNDPCDSRFINSGPNPSTRQANCAAAGLDPDFQSNIVDFTVQGSLSGNQNLVNEKANAWTVGAVLRPRFLRNFTLAVDWVDIEVQDAVQSLSATNILEACYDSADFPNSLSASGTNFCELFDRDAGGQIDFIRTGFENAAQFRFEGLIAELAYRIDTPFLGSNSSLNLGVNYLYNHELDLQVGTSDRTTLRGSIGYSKHQFTSNLTYKNDGFAWQWQAQYFGKALIDPDAEANAYDFPQVDDLVLFNTSLTYNVNDRLRVSLVVDNVFDTKQPFPVPAGGGSVTYFDAIRGRYFRFGAGIKF
jgi:iron complex outermembrane receptor protein